MQAVGAIATADWLLDASLPALYDLLECLRPLGPFWNLTRPNRHGNPPSRASTSFEGAKNFVVVHKDTSKEEAASEACKKHRSDAQGCGSVIVIS